LPKKSRKFVRRFEDENRRREPSNVLASVFWHTLHIRRSVERNLLIRAAERAECSDAVAEDGTVNEITMPTRTS